MVRPLLLMVDGMGTELGCALWALIPNQSPIWTKRRGKNHSIERMYTNTCLNIRQISAQHIGINGDLWSGVTWWENLNIDIDECLLCCRSNSYDIWSIFDLFFEPHFNVGQMHRDLGPGTDFGQTTYVCDTWWPNWMKWYSKCGKRGLGQAQF